MSSQLKPKDMYILRGAQKIEVRSENFSEFYWPETIWFEGKEYKFGHHIPLTRERSYVWSGSAIYDLVK